MRRTSPDRAPQRSRCARLRGAALAALFAAFAAIACARSAPEPNLVVVTLDTTRADHLGLYGYFRDTSPALDAFAREAIVFDRFVVPMATTLPTHTSLFTGVDPLEHGVLANSSQGGRRFVPTPRLRSLAEITRAAGWRTAAFVSAAPLKRGSGIESGFEHFDEPANAQRRGEETTAAALAWLAQQTSGRFLLWVHYYDAHFPYAPPPPFAMMFATDAELEARIEKLRVPRTVFRPLVEKVEETRASINAYDGELRYQDTQLGALLGALAARPDWERTAVVVLGDHGEGLGQHDEAAHGGTWNEQLHAPLVMRIPGEAPRREPALISAADVFPTLLGRLTLPAFAALLAQTSGRDVLSDGARSGVLSQDTGRLRETEGFRFALTTERWKLFEIESREGAPRHLLFDLEQDPFELRNVSERHPGVTQQLANELAATRVAKAQRGLALRKGETATSPADPRLREQLEALGYVDEEPSPR